MKKVLILFGFLITILFSTNLELQAGAINQESEFMNITIFIKFADEESYTAPYDYQHYDDMLNGEDMVSLRDYYLEVTYGELTINSIIPNIDGEIIYYTDINDRSYFEPYDETTNQEGYVDDQSTSREHQLIKRAMAYVDDNDLISDDLVIDANDDGMIDCLTFMISGEDNGWNSLFWPHKWELHSFIEDGEFDADAPTINGKNGYTYTWELLGNSRGYANKVDVAVLCHETFHLLSAPDLYHYDRYQYISPIGEWGLMEDEGSIPSHMLGYMKHQYGGWIDTVDEITEAGTYTLYPLQDSPDNIYKLWTGIENEWIYFEYRDDAGLYESNLPDSGLLVYRVNNNVEGNEDGSYNEADTPADEVFIFRPYMDDEEEPIVLLDGTEYFEDGKVDLSALSQTNSFDEMGIGSEIQMFSSWGYLLDFQIKNVTEEDGYITFDVVYTPSINLDTEGEVDVKYKEVYLYDNALMSYTVGIDNLPSEYTAYYTVNGDTPDSTSRLYDGGEITINAATNQVQAAIYEGDVLLYIIEETYTFETEIETDHDNYGNMRDTVWYFDFGVYTEYTLDFNDLSEFEIDFDYLHLVSDSGTLTYTGTTLSGVEIDYGNTYFVINLDSDNFVDDLYGFQVDIIPTKYLTIDILGDDTVFHNTGKYYLDEGAEVIGENAGAYTIQTIDNVDKNTFGVYEVIYNLLDSEGNVVLTKIRTVYIVDRTAPSVTLIEGNAIYIELGSVFVDPYITVKDNYDTELDVEVIGTVNTDSLSATLITYVVTDSSGNETTVFRFVYVVD